MSFKDGIFTYEKCDFEESSEPWTSNSFSLSGFDEELRRKWDLAEQNGYFRYKLDIEDTKVFGDNKYICQLNVKRAQERRKPDAIMSVSQPFNPDTFNFTKIKDGEILFEMTKGNNSDVQSKGDSSAGHLTNGYHDAVVNNGTDSQCHKKKARTLVVINVSPLEYGHVLLIPDVDACRPQVLSEEAVDLAFESMLLSKHRGFHVGFNSLCALSSVNHLHLHAYYLDQELFSESASVEHVHGCLYEMKALPAKAFAFQLHGSSMKQMSRMIYEISDYCVQNEVAHNFYMTKGPVFGEQRNSLKRTIRVYFWARRKVVGNDWLGEDRHKTNKCAACVKDEAAFNVALVELAGHIPIKIREQYANLDVEYIEATLGEANLEETEYSRVKEAVIKICDSYS